MISKEWKSRISSLLKLSALQSSKSKLLWKWVRESMATEGCFQLCLPPDRNWEREYCNYSEIPWSDEKMGTKNSGSSTWKRAFCDPTWAFVLLRKKWERPRWRGRDKQKHAHRAYTGPYSQKWWAIGALRTRMMRQHPRHRRVSWPIKGGTRRLCLSLICSIRWFDKLKTIIHRKVWW